MFTSSQTAVSILINTLVFLYLFVCLFVVSFVSLVVCVCRLFVDMEVKCILGLVVLVAASAWAEEEVSSAPNLTFILFIYYVFMGFLCVFNPCGWFL